MNSAGTEPTRNVKKSSFNRKVAVVSVFVLLLSVFSAVFVSQQNQDTRSKAAVTTFTMGYSGIGTLTDSNNSNRMHCNKYPAPSAGVITSMSAYVGSVNEENRLYSLAVYADSSGAPGALLGAGANGTLTANSWNTLPVSATVVAGSNYWFCYNSNSAYGPDNNLKYTPGSTPIAHKVQTFGTWPSPFGTPGGTSANTYSLYATVSQATEQACTFYSDTATKIPTNLALNRTSRASSVWELGAGYEASKAFDGNLATRWNAQSGTQFNNNQWLSIDLGSTTTYNRVIVKEITAPRVTAYKVQWSNDGVNYSDIPATNGTTIGFDKLIDFSKITSRYVRLYMNTATALPTINEVEVYNVEEVLSPAVATYNQNPRWTASIPGATWVWSSYFAQEPVSGETKTFVKTFYTSTPVIGPATLNLATDNNYEVYLNGVRIYADPSEFNYFLAEQDTYNLAPHIRNGKNVLRFQITNMPSAAGLAATPQINPGGLLFKLAMKSYDCSDVIPTSEEPTPDPVGLTMTYNGKSKDLVGAADVAVGADGNNDGVFTVNLSATKTIARIDLTGPGNTHWNTNPNDVFWTLGAATNPNGPLINASNSSVNFTANSFTMFASDGGGNKYFAPGNVMYVQVEYSDGSTSNGYLTIPGAEQTCTFQSDTTNTLQSADGRLDGDGNAVATETDGSWATLPGATWI